MGSFISELRRRAVFRTAGIYIGACWIVIEVGNVLIPAFSAPEWILRALIVTAVVGFPFVCGLAWIFEITAHGIERETAVPDAPIPLLGQRKADFVVIALLVMALSFSVYLNVASGPETSEPLAPLSVLVADFDNQTGDSIYDGLLEQALNIGIESAPHISSYSRPPRRPSRLRLQSRTSRLATSARPTPLRKPRSKFPGAVRSGLLQQWYFSLPAIPKARERLREICRERLIPIAGPTDR